MTDSIPQKRRVPHWGWWFAGAALTAVAVIAFRFGPPIYRQQLMIGEFTNRGIQVSAIAEPLWLPLWPAVFSSSVQIVCPDRTFNDEDLRRAVDLRRLQLLVVMETRVTDSGLRYLSRAADLQWLYLDETVITDDGLDAIAECKRLKLLTVRRTRVTPEGVAKLRLTLPGCEIIGP